MAVALIERAEHGPLAFNSSSHFLTSSAKSGDRDDPREMPMTLRACTPYSLQYGVPSTTYSVDMACCRCLPLLPLHGTANFHPHLHPAGIFQHVAEILLQVFQGQARRHQRGKQWSGEAGFGPQTELLHGLPEGEGEREGQRKAH